MGSRANLVGLDSNDNSAGEYDNIEDDTPGNRRKVHRLLGAFVFIAIVLSLFGLAIGIAALVRTNNIPNSAVDVPLSFLYAFDNGTQFTGEEDSVPDLFVPMRFNYVADSSPFPPGWDHPNPQDFVAGADGNYTVQVSASPGTVFPVDMLNSTQFWMVTVITTLSGSSIVQGSLCTETLFGNGGGSGFSPFAVVNVMSLPILVTVSSGDILNVFWGYETTDPSLFVSLNPSEHGEFDFVSPYVVSGLPAVSSSASIVITQVE